MKLWKFLKNDFCWDVKTDDKQQEIKELVAVSSNFFEWSNTDLKYNVKQACIFHLIFLGIPSSLVLSVKSRGLLNEQNPLSITKAICDVLHDLVPFVQFKKREKHPWRSINFSKVAGLPNRATHHIWVVNLLTHFMLPMAFYNRCKHQKKYSFKMFSRSIGRDQWYEIS